jgi:hypothetical protein
MGGSLRNSGDYKAQVYQPYRLHKGMPEWCTGWHRRSLQDLRLRWDNGLVGCRVSRCIAHESEVCCP